MKDGVIRATVSSQYFNKDKLLASCVKGVSDRLTRNELAGILKGSQICCHVSVLLLCIFTCRFTNYVCSKQVSRGFACPNSSA